MRWAPCNPHVTGRSQMSEAWQKPQACITHVYITLTHRVLMYGRKWAAGLLILPLTLNGCALSIPALWMHKHIAEIKCHYHAETQTDNVTVHYIKRFLFVCFHVTNILHFLLHRLIPAPQSFNFSLWEITALISWICKTLEPSCVEAHLFCKAFLNACHIMHHYKYAYCMPVGNHK